MRTYASFFKKTLDAFGPQALGEKTNEGVIFSERISGLQEVDFSSLLHQKRLECHLGNNSPALKGERLMRHIVLIYGLIFQMGCASALDGIDVFYESKGDQKTFRIMRYDIDHQKFISIHKLCGKDAELGPELEKARKDLPLTIGLDGSVTLTNMFDPGKFMVRATVSINAAEVPVVLKEKKPLYQIFLTQGPPSLQDQRYKAVYRTTVVAPFKDVQGKLQTTKQKIAGGADVPVTVFPPEPKVTTLGNVGKNSLGVIGETATELTVLSLGYDQFTTKYEANHGLDGVFASPDLSAYIITESKCWGKKETAQKTLKNYLGEQNINDRIQKGLGKKGDKIIQGSMKALEDFILDHPESVLKFAHRTTLVGISQGAVELIKAPLYRQISSKPQAKELDISGIIKAIESASARVLEEVAQGLSPEKIKALSKILASEPKPTPQLFDLE